MPKDKKTKITFRYVYPEHLRDLYVNGAWGGVTPRKEIYMHMYSERHPIPKSSTHVVNEHGEIGKVIDKETGGDVVRLIQASVVMDLSTAISIRDWLTRNIEFAQALTKKED